jgi:hypothetical protein
MLVRGEWQLRDDGVMRPIVRARVGGDSSPIAENFSQRRNEILLLASRHQYRIERT